MSDQKNDPEKEEKKGWFSRLKSGLSKSSTKLTQGISDVLTKRKLDDTALEELEEALIAADLGVDAAGEVVDNLRRTRFGKDVEESEIKQALADAIAEILEPVAQPLELDADTRPNVILVVGVNGSGKTTTIGKIAQQLTTSGKSVMLAAGDTFRAAAVEQLKIWADRTGASFIANASGSDAAALAYDALTQAKEKACDVLMIDTAGRLQNKKDLMEELAKVRRTLQKIDPETPHHTLLVLDATIGQNTISQVTTFKEMVDVSGLVVTKLDGSARGGVLVSLAKSIGLPVHAIGVGEKAEDLQPFTAQDYARNLVGLGKTG